MCLGAPAQVVAVNDLVATVEVHGEAREVALVLLDEPVSKGDHVIVHLGFAVRRIAPEDVEETMAAFEALTADIAAAT